MKINSDDIKEAVKVYLEARKRESLRKNEVVGLCLLQIKGKPCDRCGSMKNLTIDHIVPRKILIELGFDWETEFLPENIRPLCKPCNSYKTDRLDITLPETKQVLLKLLTPLL